MNWPTDRDLSANGWQRDGVGWTKNGAFYASWGEGGCVGQFECSELAVQIDLSDQIPSAVILHLINAMAEAKSVLYLGAK